MIKQISFFFIFGKIILIKKKYSVKFEFFLKFKFKNNKRQFIFNEFDQ